MELTLLTPVCLLCCEADPALMLIMLASLCWSCRVCSLEEGSMLAVLHVYYVVYVADDV